MKDPIGGDPVAPEIEHLAGELAGLSLEQLVAHVLERHHAYVWHEEDRLRALVREVAAAHADAHHELDRVEDLVDSLFVEMRHHQLREEHVLFPHLVALSCALSRGSVVPAAPFASVVSPTRVLELQHDMVGTLLEELRARTNGYRTPEGASAAWIALYGALDALERDVKRHMYIENEVLFPLARAVEAQLSGRG